MAMVDALVDVLAQQLVGRIAKHLCCRRADEGKAAVPVEAVDGLADRLQQHLEGPRHTPLLISSPRASSAVLHHRTVLSPRSIPRDGAWSLNAFRSACAGFIITLCYRHIYVVYWPTTHVICGAQDLLVEQVRMVALEVCHRREGSGRVRGTHGVTLLWRCSRAAWL